MPTMVEVDQYKSALTPQQVDTALKKIADNDIADFMTQAQADARYLQKTALLNLVYPVGSIYMSANATSPASFLGGSWERIQGRFLLAASSSYTAGSTGGEATHTLTEAELPEISGSFGGTSSGNAWGVLGTSSGVFSRSDPIPAPTNTEKSSTMAAAWVTAVLRCPLCTALPTVLAYSIRPSTVTAMTTASMILFILDSPFIPRCGWAACGSSA